MVANGIELTGVFDGSLDQSGIVWPDALPFARLISPPLAISSDIEPCAQRHFL
jgi:hypothetical protein